jgi:hypothetical protein
VPVRICVLSDEIGEPGRDLVIGEEEEVKVALPLALPRVDVDMSAHVPCEAAVELFVVCVEVGAVAGSAQVPERLWGKETRFLGTGFVIAAEPVQTDAWC